MRCGSWLILAGTALGSAVAQQAGTLQGVVRDELGNVVADENVRLISATRHELVAELQTDSAGTFTFDHLDNGAYDLQAVGPGLCLANMRGMRVDREPATVLLETPERSPIPKLIRVSSIVQQRRLIRSVTPEYPENALAAGLGGTVTVDIVVDEMGALISVTSPSDRDSILIQAAIAAAEQWRYRTTALKCVPVQIESQIHFDFSVASGEVRL
jgi:TonB family protein